MPRIQDKLFFSMYELKKGCEKAKVQLLSRQIFNCKAVLQVLLCTSAENKFMGEGIAFRTKRYAQGKGNALASDMATKR